MESNKTNDSNNESERSSIPTEGFGGGGLMLYSASTATENPAMPRGKSGEIRVKDPETGGEKCSKLAQYSLIPTQSLHDLAEHYGKGAGKYSRHNWRKGYPWSLSFDALNRHLNAFWSGEDFDPETGSKHITAAAWHCFTLATFMDEFPDKDDRFKTTIKLERRM